ncbi:methyltransferase domain-containing protein [bacterium]|nr:methyltransferase domain-containing protein [bacterium]
MTPPRFDWLAPHYAWVEAATYGGLLHWCRTALLGELTDARRVLILGEGDGRFVSAFLAANPVAVVDVVDASAAMVALARRRVARLPGAADRVRWHVADARRFAPPAAPYDLVVTNFFLDCFPASGLTALVPHLAAALAPGGRWLVGDFALSAGGPARLAARAALAAMYAAFHLTTRIPARRLVDPSPLLRGVGMELVREERRLRGFLTASLWRKEE